MINKRMILSLSILCQALILCAQEPTEVKEKTDLIGDWSGNALYVNIHRAEKKLVLKELRSQLKDKGGEVKQKSKELSATGISFPLISDSTVNVKAEIQEEGELLTNLMVMFKYNDTILSSSNNSTGFHSAKAFLFELGHQLSKEANEKHLREQEKELESLEKKLKLLKNRLEKEEKTIVNSNKLIKKNRSAVEKIDQSGELDEDAIKTRAKSERAILNHKEKVKNAEYEIEINKKEQKEVVQQIKDQRETVNKAKQSLDVFK